MTAGRVHCAQFAAGLCRSCAWIELDYATQLTRKQEAAGAALPELAPGGWLPPLTGALTGFRNKAKLAVGGSATAPLLGIVEADGRQVDLTDCLLYPPELVRAFAPLRAFITAADLQPYDLATRRGELKFMLLTVAPQDQRLLLRFVLRSREPLDRIRRHLPALETALPQLAVVSVNLQPVHQAVLEGPEEILIAGTAALTMQLNGLPLALRPGGFFQTHTALAAALYAEARAWCAALQPVTVWDLYAGVGGFALHCALPGRTVTGVESHPDAVASAQATAQAIGADVRFVCADATQWVQSQSEVPDLVIVNPPRRGLGQRLSEWLQNSAVPHLLYSSCNIDSLAADLKRMAAFGPIRARLLDLFPHTPHFETLIWLSRRPH